MNSEPTIPADANEAIYATGADPEGDLPIYCAHRRPSGIPGFIDRMLTHMQSEPTEGDFTFEDVEFTIAGGVWLAPVGVYQIEEETPSTAEEIALGASPTGPYGNVMLEWATGVRQAMNDAWGEPTIHTPRLVGSEETPEGILDYLLIAQDFESADLWDRGEFFVAMLTDWSGEPAQSDLRQIVMVLPREFIMNGMSALIGDEGSAHELLMHGEHLLELHRRAWILSAAFGHGEVRLRDAPIEATRCSLQAVNGTTTVSMFADDGRALVLIQDPESEFAQTAAAQFMAEQLGDDEPSDEALAEARLILSERLLDGIPSDLRACIAVRGETMRGDVAEHELEFGILGDQPIPVISGAFWCDGETWHTTGGLMSIGKRNGFGMDDFGVATALRRPYRLGGEFTVDLFTSQDNVERREQLEQIFAACPYLEQPRPEGDVRLGYSIPSDTTRGEIVDDIERVTAAWWDHSPADAKLGDDTFRVAHRSAARSDDPDLLNFVLAQSTHWTVDALQEWNSDLISVMSERWGDRRDVGVEDANGDERRTPLSRVMRGTGLRHGSLWWVNGHAVVLLAGMPDPSYSPEPQVVLVIARADTLIELFGRMSIWDARLRTRALRNLAAIAAVPEGETPSDTEQPIAWDGPALQGSEIVPRATRGGLRAGNFFWVWYFTHDGRALLTSHEIGAQTGSFEEQVSLFDGVPADLATLIADRDSDGLYPTVQREGDPHSEDQLARAHVLPNAKAVFFHDGTDWRASPGMLRKAYAAGVAAVAANDDADVDVAVDVDVDVDVDVEALASQSSGALTVDPLTELYSEAVGVPQLQWALRVGKSLWSEPISEPEYARFAFSREVSLAEAESAYIPMRTALGSALLGDLNALLDVITVGPGYRGVLDAALSHTDPHTRRELALWLLGEGVDASLQLSFMTPIHVLLENPTLEAADAVLITRLLESGADPGFGLTGARTGGHPLVQLCERDADETGLLPLVESLLESGKCDMLAAALPDGRTALEYVRAGRFTHQRSRAQMLELLEACAAAQLAVPGEE